MGQLNQAGIDLIKSYESCQLRAYPDPATNSAPWTIGWGHTGPDVNSRSQWSKKHCDDILKLDLQILSRRMKRDLVLPPSLTDNQFSAMLSFAYNAGLKALEEVLDAVGLPGFAQQIQVYVHAGPSGKKRVLKGLVNRRAAEAALFKTPPKEGLSIGDKISGDFPLSSRRYF